ncbi:MULTISPECIES: M23 family metallopeptidase [Asticcacaulis]|uniref:M23 family metallopeptidase n=1 Tax=Asticcacaulis TaxID=76890 RepID=UPI001AE98BDC|nr:MULTISPECIES: M23 family metallopeptidase [Asticcacaulis]MBP2158533.1 murein DD-endopeptidase MepM/ murein hydrolase activator NlpD [Asticcacaulis solisilvae]MDR6799579.1 murein DD-endopeptidase MepM/ murein hydrolase activator NlpD [Asticcacaulis sp. BE141]
MTPNDRRLYGKLWPIGAIGAVMLMLQACTGTMPQPRYPVYMQDKPAEATQTVAQAGDDAPQPAPEPQPSVTPQGNPGGIQTTELAPPPPPPPPPPAKDDAPVRGETAPVKDTRAAYVYVLQPKDTLYGVSRRFGVPVKVLYEMNGLAPNASLRIGQKILLPATAVDKGKEEHANGPGMVRLDQALAAKPATPAPAATPVPAAPAKPAATKPAVTPPSATTTTTTTTTKPAVAPPGTKPLTTTTTTTTTTTPAKPVTSAGFPSNAQLAQMGKGLFTWPVKGRIIVPFGQLAPNVRNDGINIAAEAGTEVKAASDGVVVYQGDQVKELGNTVYIKHPNGWYTGYSHLQTMSVKNNEKVTKGQMIGKVGQSGVIDRPQLHFEIRYTPSTDIARPVDPTLVLP